MSGVGLVVSRANSASVRLLWWGRRRRKSRRPLEFLWDAFVSSHVSECKNDNWRKHVHALKGFYSIEVKVVKCTEIEGANE